MTWTKLDDGIFDHPKMVKAGEDAANLYVRALVYCNRYLTDGRIEEEVLGVITRKRDAARLADALVRVGAWEPHPDGGWVVHNFHEHNPTAEEVEARRAAISRKRSEAGKRGGLRSGEVRSNEAKPKQDASSPSKQNEASEDEATKQNGSPVPSRPVPTVEEKTQSLAPPSASPPPALTTVATPPTPSLDLVAPTPKPAKPKRTPKPPADPPPFSMADAFAALASTSSGRFVAGVEGDWTGGVCIAIRKTIRRYPDLAAWRLVGAWLAAGGDAYRNTIGPSWAASAAFPDAMARAREWDERGRGAVSARHLAVVEAPVADAWTVAAARAGVHL